jgi:hypothetical protein
MSERTPEEEELARQQAEKEKLLRERMEAYGYDPDNAAEKARFEELEAKRAADRITQQDVFRGMETFKTEQADKERREEAKHQQLDAVKAPEQVRENDQKTEEPRRDKAEFDRERPRQAPPERGGMAEHQNWVQEEARARSDRRRQEEQELKPERKQGGQDIDLTRFRADPDYRREITAGLAQQRREQREQEQSGREQEQQRKRSGRQR